jgi:hypothetical protein
VTQHIYDDAMRNTKFFPILPDGGGESDIPTFLKPWWNSHRFPSRNAGIHHMIVLAFCGFRVRRGVVLVSSRKLSRFRAGLARTEAAHEAGAATSAEAQRHRFVTGNPRGGADAGFSAAALQRTR